MPETANVSLEEVDKLFKSDASREDAVLKEEVRFWFTYLRARIVDLCCENQITRDVGLDALIQELLATAASDEP